MAILRISLSSLFLILSISSAMASQPIKGTYWPSWSESHLPPSAIRTDLFTHIYYAFLNPNTTTFEFDVSASTAQSLRNFTSTLRSKNPPVKTLFSVGGAGEDPAIFAQMASESESRKRFILSSIGAARKYGFHGVDLDWESPKDPKEMEDFGILLREWRAEVQKEARATRRPPLLLTAAVYFASDFFLANVYRAFPAALMGRTLDLINVMNYDYHGSWEPNITGAHAALYDPNTNISTSYGLTSWINAGAPRNKLVMGLPLYGKTWTLRDRMSSGIGAPAVGLGPGDQGVLRYAELQEFNAKNNATVVYDEQTVSVYSVAGMTWIGYDDERSTAAKVAYAQGLGLRGYFFWAVNGDYRWQISRAASKAWVRT